MTAYPLRIQERGRSLTEAAPFFLFFLLLALGGCASEGAGLNVGHYTVPGGTPHEFTVCHGYGCRYKSPAHLTEAQWAAIRAPLARAAPTAEEERENIATAISLMERAVGEAVGTASDDPGAAFTFVDPGQQDCIDETINTTHYLEFLAAEGLLRHHAVEKPARRGFFVDGRWPHNTAVIRDTASGQKYVVDSWFLKNGEKPFILPVETWLAGWQPEEN